ncbi:hypothetical protein Pint_12263 [Pistacia integerrima]|uniref:Uncharacterized protein n=1 Tax=Pistacia integerrima TaxID=434235 RepID=A0ACC0XFE4_9ROSI|nr:hypothetical protein Pint_12263 [Pistacia integerrima]
MTTPSTSMTSPPPPLSAPSTSKTLPPLPLSPFTLCPISLFLTTSSRRLPIGFISIFDADPFVLLKSVKAQKKGVNDLAVHPSGKLALSVGRDECLAMVDLVRRRSFYHKLGKEVSLIKFDLSGDKYFMVTEEKIRVHQAEDAKLLCELEGNKRVLCAALGEVCFILWFICFVVIERIEKRKTCE